MPLRPYQQEAVDALFNYFTEHTGNPVIAMPTGTGKSHVIAEAVRTVLHWYPDQRVQMVTHVKELIEQNLGKLLSAWPSAPAGVYSAGMGRKEAHFPITFGGIASMYRQPEIFGHVDLMFIDECHLVAPRSDSMYSAYINALKQRNPHLKVIGLSATPYRMSHGHLTDGDIFTHVCFDNTTLGQFNELVRSGYLAPLVPKPTHNEIDVDGVHVRQGEYITSEVEQKLTDDILQRTLEELVEFGDQQQREHWLIFAPSIDRVERTVELLQEMGISACAVHSKIKDREQVLSDYVSGRYRAAVNCDMLTTGFDFPGIDLIGMLRPTRSPGLWVQMLGRGTRPAPGKQNCMVLDFAGNTKRLGPINDPVLPSKRSKGGGGTAPVKICPSCITYVPASVRHCGECGYEFPIHFKVTLGASTAELIRSDKQAQPVEEWFGVDRVTYQRHTKAGRPDSLRVSYFCGLRRFTEYVCIEHPGSIARKAAQWWDKRSKPFTDRPTSTLEALDRVESLRTPVRVKVRLSGKFPSILDYHFEEHQ